MIQLSMTSSEGVTLDTAGKYCAENVQITPVLQAKSVTAGETQQIITADNGHAGLSQITVEAALNYRKFSGEIVSEVVGASTAALLLTDPVIAAHYQQERFAVLVNFYYDEAIAYAPYTFTACNSRAALIREGVIPASAASDICQYGVRYESDASLGGRDNPLPVSSAEGNSNGSVYRLRADGDGNLYILPRSANYAIRPCSYTVEVKW